MFHSSPKTFLPQSFTLVKQSKRGSGFFQSWSWHMTKIEVMDKTVYFCFRSCQASRDRSGPVSTHSSAKMASDKDTIDSVTAHEKTADIVSEILRRVEHTDRGVNASPEQRKEIDRLIEQVTINA